MNILRHLRLFALTLNMESFLKFVIWWRKEQVPIINA
jgi:hypothetical protein